MSTSASSQEQSPDKNEMKWATCLFGTIQCCTIQHESVQYGTVHHSTHVKGIVTRPLATAVWIPGANPICLSQE